MILRFADEHNIFSNPKNHSSHNNGVAYGPGLPLIRLQALSTRLVSAAIPNTDSSDLITCDTRALARAFGVVNL